MSKKLLRFSIANKQREKASSYISGKAKQMNQNYRLLSIAVVKTVIQDGDIDFFSERNPMKDIFLELSGISYDWAYEKTKETYEKIRIFDSLHKSDSRKWTKQELAKFFHGELTAQEISILTGLKVATIYKYVFENSDFKIRIPENVNTPQIIDSEKLKKYL